MRVSLNKIALIEKLITQPNNLNLEEQALYASYKILDHELEETIADQRKTVELIRQSGKLELMQEINEVHRFLFHPKSTHPLKNKILRLFTK